MFALGADRWRGDKALREALQEVERLRQPADQIRALDSFVQVDASVGRTFGGSGLGLTITRSLVALMQGHLTLESSPGAGTAVRLILPLARIAPCAAGGSVEAGVPRPLMGLRLLVADDTAAKREVLALTLRRMGAGVVECEDGMAALASWQGRRFDAALLDINMPGLDGMALIARIRAAEAEAEATLPRMPAIAVTANAGPEHEAQYRAAGFDSCVGKPFRKETLLGALQGQGAVAPPPAAHGAALWHGRA